MDDISNKTIAIIGCGIVGQSWSIVFSTSGCHVNVYDNDQKSLQHGLHAIKTKMMDLESKGSLRGTLSADEAFSLIRPTSSLRECVAEACYIQECVFDEFELKHSVFLETENYINADAIMASSTGQIFPSRLSEGLNFKARLVAAHPLNPPHLVPLVEIIPAPWTDPDVITTVRALMESVGQEPIVAKKETAGFIICRVQHAITAECFKLIRDDVISVNDLDKLMPAGLGLRYAFLGALETSYLNANGMVDFCQRYADKILQQQIESGGPIALEGDTLHKIQGELEKRIPLDKLEDRRKWRDERLVELFKLKMQEKKKAGKE